MAKPKYEWLDRRIAKPGPYICLCLTADELADARDTLTQHPLEFPDTGARCYQFKSDRDGSAICLVALSEDAQKNNCSIEVAGMLVHEAVHVWQYYAECMGETKPADEQEAYAIQAVSQELMAEYARRLNG